MNNIFLCLILLLSCNLSAQKNELSKRELQKILKSTIDNDAKKTITTSTNCWSADNTNQSYHLNDTIKLFNPRGFSICETIDWTFYSPRKFVMTESFRCQEPPTLRLADADHYFRMELVETELGLVIETFSTKFKERFRVVSVDLEKGDYSVERVDSMTVITLVRLK